MSVAGLRPLPFVAMMATTTLVEVSMRGRGSLIEHDRQGSKIPFVYLLGTYSERRSFCSVVLELEVSFVIQKRRV